ncbi:MAG: WD40 repeat domain-containing protein [Nitrospira sp.]|nr:WD40 repeat domain-containing protein [Nitrospira sp.]
MNTRSYVLGRTLLVCTVWALAACKIGFSAENTERVLLGHTDGVAALSFSTNGQLLASGGHDLTARLWDIQSGKELAVLFEGSKEVSGYTAESPPPNVLSVAFSPKRDLVAIGTRDGVARIFDVRTLETRAILRGHRGGIRSIYFDPTGQLLATASHDATIRIWNLNTKALVQELLGHTNAVRTAVFSSDGSRVVSGSEDGTVRYWETETGRMVKTVSLNAGEIFSLALSGGGFIAAGCADGSIHIWKIGEESKQWTFQGHRGPVFAVSINASNDLLVSGGEDETIRIWNFKMRTELKNLKVHSAPVIAVSFSPDGKYFASGKLRRQHPHSKSQSRTRAIILKKCGLIKDLKTLVASWLRTIECSHQWIGSRDRRGYCRRLCGICTGGT